MTEKHDDPFNVVHFSLVSKVVLPLSWLRSMISRHAIRHNSLSNTIMQDTTDGKQQTCGIEKAKKKKKKKKDVHLTGLEQDFYFKPFTEIIFSDQALSWYNHTGWLGVKHQFTTTTIRPSYYSVIRMIWTVLHSQVTFHLLTAMVTVWVFLHVYDNQPTRHTVICYIIIGAILLNMKTIPSSIA